MTPQNFILANGTVGKTETGENEIEALPIFNDGARSLSSWRMSWRERLSAFFFGNAWVWIQAGKSQPPMMIEVSRNPLKTLKPKTK